MQQSARRPVQKVTVERQSEFVEASDQSAANFPVTDDGTWQKRGHSSL